MVKHRAKRREASKPSALVRATKVRPRGGYKLLRGERRPTPRFEETVLRYVRSHKRKGRGVRGHARRVHRHTSLIGPADKLYPWGTLYHCTSCGEPVIRDERAVRRFGPRRSR